MYEITPPRNPLQMIKESFKGVLDDYSLKLAKIRCEHILMYTSPKELDEAIDLVSSLEESAKIMIDYKKSMKKPN